MERNVTAALVLPHRRTIPLERAKQCAYRTYRVGNEVNKSTHFAVAHCDRNTPVHEECRLVGCYAVWL
jgi:hypothetical protein